MSNIPDVRKQEVIMIDHIGVGVSNFEASKWVKDEHAVDCGKCTI